LNHTFKACLHQVPCRICAHRLPVLTPSW
jgi:hypothetical protein